MEPELDILIPVYNEGDKIAATLNALASAVKTPCRVLICHDRDDDDTLPPARAFRGPFQVAFVKNRGAGPHGAITTGFSESLAPAVLVFPADDDFNGGIIDAMVGCFREGCDIVCASRFMPGGAMEGCPWLKYALVRSSAWALYHIAGLPTRDPTNGFRLFSRRALAQIPIESSLGFTYSIELLVKAHRLGLKIAEVPAIWKERRTGGSRFRVLRWLPAYLRWFFYAFATTLRGATRTLSA